MQVKVYRAEVPAHYWETCKSERPEVDKTNGLTLLPASPREAQLRPQSELPCKQAPPLQPCQVLAERLPSGPIHGADPELHDGDSERLGTGQIGTLDGPNRDADPTSCIEVPFREPVQETLGTPRPWIPQPAHSLPRRLHAAPSRPDPVVGSLPCAPSGGGDRELWQNAGSNLRAAER